MKTEQPAPNDIDAYIARFAPEVQETLQQIRATIREAAPDATEKISYGMPTFALKGNLVHFAAYKTHIGFYPTPSGIERFQDELSGYELSKGTVRFPLDQPVPLDLIGEMVRFRVGENLERAETRRRRK